MAMMMHRGYASENTLRSTVMNATNGEDSKKADAASGIWMAMGINLGVAVGVAIGVSVENLGAGIGIGLGLGVSIGALARMMIMKKSRQDAAGKEAD